MNKLKLASIEAKKERTTIKVGNVEIGKDLVIIGGPCSVESEEQTIKSAIAVKKGGGDMLRGGAFKPRTSPYDFQGLGMTGLKILDKARRETGLPIVTEVVDARDVSWVCEYADVIQIGARNMQNFSLLKEAGRARKPVLLKRGMYSTLSEWINCAEYILAEGNPDVILCERGIRTFETYTRNTLDLSIVPAVKEVTHLPIMVDPSHGTGRLSLISPMAMAAVVAGADGIIVEVHIDPAKALSDAAQQLKPDEFLKLTSQIRKLKKCHDQIISGKQQGK